MSLIGNVNLTQKYDKHGKNFHDLDDNYFNNFKEKFPDEAETILQGATYREVRPLVEHVEAAVKKNDTPYIYPTDKDENYKLAKKFARIYLAPYLSAPVTMPGEALQFNSASSAGIIGKKTGYPKTSAYLNSEPFKKYAPRCNLIPLQLVNHKDEFLSILDDLSRNKVRLVDCVDKTFLLKQKLLYDNQNKNFSKNWRSGKVKYGMVKQYGGFNELVTLFEKCIRLGLSDNSGYDKSAILQDVYELRNEFLILPKDADMHDFFIKIQEHVTKWTLNPVRVLSNGDIVLQDKSNSSGQNNTTIDNCILHIIICFDLVITLFFFKFHRMPEWSEFLPLFELAIYSDDKVLGLNEGFEIDDEDYIRIEREVYAKYGMTIKVSASKTFTHKKNTRFLGDDVIEFLGSEGVWSEENDCYLPKPRSGKLCTTLSKKLVLDKNNLTPVEQFSKLIMIRSLLIEVGPNLLDAVNKFILFTVDSYPQHLTEFYGLMEVFNLNDGNVSDPNAFMYLITGNESSLQLSTPKTLNIKQFANPNSLHFFMLGDLDGWLDLIVLYMESISKAEKKIKLLSEKVGASEEGTLWIKETLDPFSDTPRRPVGFPDLITGNSIVQVVKQTKTISIGATASDVHIFQDTIDTSLLMYQNDFYNTASPSMNGRAFYGTAIGGVGGHLRGGLVVRQGNVGSIINAANTVTNIPLPASYTSNGTTRVLGKAFEVHNTTNKLNVGGAVTVYRDCGSANANDNLTVQAFSAGSETISIGYTRRDLPRVPESLAEVTNIPGSQQWEAKDGCYCVSTMSSQTNNPTDEASEAVLAVYDSSLAAGKLYANVVANATAGKVPWIPTTGTTILASPYFLNGAFFTGLPAGTELTINCIWIIERFVDANNLDLIVMGSPSPYYDPVAMEIYSKTASRLPHGVKVGDNADGDWIKNIADVLSNFGVPGMPLVKGAVDLWNGFQGGNLKPNNSKAEQARVRNLEAKVSNMERSFVGSPSKSLVVQQNKMAKSAPKKKVGASQLPTKKQRRAMAIAAANLPPPMNARK